MYLKLPYLLLVYAIEDVGSFKLSKTYLIAIQRK